MVDTDISSKFKQTFITHQCTSLLFFISNNNINIKKMFYYATEMEETCIIKYILCSLQWLMRNLSKIYFSQYLSLLLEFYIIIEINKLNFRTQYLCLWHPRKKNVHTVTKDSSELWSVRQS